MRGPARTAGADNSPSGVSSSAGTMWLASAAAPNGIDVVFENVGAPSLDAALPAMVLYGRVILCGLAAHYNSAEPASFSNIVDLLFKQVSVTPLATNPKMRVTRRGCSGGWGEGDGVAEGLQLVYVVALLSVWV